MSLNVILGELFIPIYAYFVLALFCYVLIEMHILAPNLLSFSIRFLWRNNATFAISKHYRRFDVFVEAEANKAAAKYDNASIDFQIEFYKKEGLTPYTEAKLPLISGTPNFCLILRRDSHVSTSTIFLILDCAQLQTFLKDV